MTNTKYSRPDDLEKLKAFIARHRGIILTTHHNPDPDGVGSEIALAELLTKLGVHCAILNDELLLSKYQEIDPEDNIQCIITDKGHGERWIDPKNEYVTKYSGYGIVLLDAGNIKRTGAVMYDFYANFDAPFIIDHHIPEKGKLDSGNSCIDIEAGSTAEIVFGLISAHDDSQLTYNQARAIYAGIVVDTGSFRYDRTTATTHEIAARLLRTGIEGSKIQDMLFDMNSIGRIKLIPLVFHTLKLYLNNRLAIFYVDSHMLEETNAKSEDTEEFVNLPLKSEDVKVSIFLKQKSPNIWSVSLRCKENYNVQMVAKQFNGGGHIRASGCLMEKATGVEELFHKLFGEVEKMMAEIGS